MKNYLIAAVLGLVALLGGWAVYQHMDARLSAVQSDLRLANGRVRALETAAAASQRAYTVRETGRNTNTRTYDEKRSELDLELAGDSAEWAASPVPAGVVRLLGYPAPDPTGAARSPPVHANP